MGSTMKATVNRDENIVDAAFRYPKHSKKQLLFDRTTSRKEQVFRKMECVKKQRKIAVNR